VGLFGCPEASFRVSLVRHSSNIWPMLIFNFAVAVLAAGQQLPG
jgi:hypothetical protein